jgi:hypothetical protein
MTTPQETPRIRGRKTVGEFLQLHPEPDNRLRALMTTHLHRALRRGKITSEIEWCRMTRGARLMPTWRTDDLTAARKAVKENWLKLNHGIPDKKNRKFPVRLPLPTDEPPEPPVAEIREFCRRKEQQGYLGHVRIEWAMQELWRKNPEASLGLLYARAIPGIR